MKAYRCSCGHLTPREPWQPARSGLLTAAMGALHRAPEIRPAFPLGDVLDAVRWGA